MTVTTQNEYMLLFHTYLHKYCQRRIRQPFHLHKSSYFCVSLMWFRIFYTNQMLLCINVVLLWKRLEPAMMCMTHRQLILVQFEKKKKKTCPRYFIQFKNRLRYSRFDPSNATSRNISAVLPWIKWLGCNGHRSAHCVGWFSPLLLPSFSPFFLLLNAFCT